MSTKPQSLRHLLEIAAADPVLSRRLALAANTAEWTRQLLALAGANGIAVNAADLDELIAYESGPQRRVLLDAELEAVAAGFLKPPTLDERYEKMKKDIMEAGGTITYCDPVSRVINFAPGPGEAADLGWGWACATPSGRSAWRRSVPTGTTFCGR
ncbi:MAG: hypothetical protein ABWY05_16630 [Noviherbaspirillum sp.]